MREPFGNESSRRVAGTLGRSAMAGLTISILVSAIIPAWARAGSIFDDDFKPASEMPRPATPTPPPEPQPPAPPPVRPSPAAAPVEPRKEKPKPAPSPTVVPSPPPKVTPPTPVPLAAQSPVRRPIPGAADQAAAEKTIKQTFSAEYKINTFEGKSALARELLNELRQSGHNSATLYVLNREARDLATAGGDIASATQAAINLRDQFLFDSASGDVELATILSTAANLCTLSSTYPPRPEFRAGVIFLMNSAEKSFAAGDYELAAKLAAQAQQIVQNTNDGGLFSKYGDRAGALQIIAAEFPHVRDAFTALKTRPGDPVASAAAGKFLSLIADRWDIGPAYLAAGNDPALKVLATQELARPTDPAKQLALASAWADLMKSAPAGPSREALRRRAVWWYERAANQPDGSASISPQRTPLAMLSLKHGLLAEYYRGDDFAARAFSRADGKLEFNWAGQPPDPDMPGQHFSVRWTGYIKSGYPGLFQLMIVHDDGARIWLDGKLILDKWGENSGRDLIPAQLTGLPQSIKIEYEQLAGNSYFGLGWIPPRTNKVRAIPADAMYHDDRAPEPAFKIIQPQSSRQPALILTPRNAFLHNSGKAILKTSDKGTAVESWPTALWLSWDVNALAGDYDLAVNYACDDQSSGATYELLADSASLTGRVADTGGWDTPRSETVGRLHLTAGVHTLRLNLLSRPHEAAMNFYEMKLTPVSAAK